MSENSMVNSKKLIANLVIILSVCGLIAGCSKINNELNLSSPSNMVITNSPSPKKALSLESWVGNYKFSEFSPPDENMFYGISIYKENDIYYGKISIFGFQTQKELQAKILGDENSIRLEFFKYLPDNRFESYTERDLLLSLEKKNSKLYTTWGKIQPMLESNNKPDEVYFKFDNSTGTNNENYLNLKPTAKQNAVNSSIPESSGTDSKIVTQEIAFKITQEEAINIVATKKGINKEDLEYSGTDESTGEYMITLSPKQSKGAAGRTYIVNPKTGSIK